MSRTWNATEHARHQQRWKQQLPWTRAYRLRMQAGLERCRHCGADASLTLAHLVPHADGGPFTPWNVTILCSPCNVKQDREVWSHLIALAKEEELAPPESRWAEIASRVSRSRVPPCPVCGESTACDERGKLFLHGNRCPGSRTGVLPRWRPDPAMFGVP